MPELDKEMIFQTYYTNDDRCLNYAVGFGGSSDEIVKVFFREELCTPCVNQVIGSISSLSLSSTICCP